MSSRRGQGLLEVHATDDVAQRGHGELLDGRDVVGDLVRRRHRVGHLEVDDGVDRDHQVVLGDHRLRREGDDLLAHVDDVAHPVDERRDDVEPGWRVVLYLPNRSTMPGACLRDDPDRLRQHEHDEDQEQQRTGSSTATPIATPLFSLRWRPSRHGSSRWMRSTYGRRTLDLDHVDHLAGLDPVVLVVRLGRPLLAADLHPAGRVVRQLAQHRGALADQRLGAGLERRAPGAGGVRRWADRPRAARPTRSAPSRPAARSAPPSSAVTRADEGAAGQHDQEEVEADQLESRRARRRA